jgi:hypothetical protein
LSVIERRRSSQRLEQARGLLIVDGSKVSVSHGWKMGWRRHRAAGAWRSEDARSGGSAIRFAAMDPPAINAPRLISP